MRIVQMTPYWLASTGGPSRYVASLRRELGDRGHHVHVVTPDAGAEGAELVSGPFPLRDLRAILTLRRLDPDIVHVHGSVRDLFAALVHRLGRPKVRVVFTFHTQPITREFLPGLIRRRHDYGVVSAIVARVLLRKADLITSVSESIISAHNDGYDLDIRHYVRIPSGGDPCDTGDRLADAPPASAAEHRGHPVLVSVGVMAWDWKVLGHLVAVRAVDELRRTYPAVLLLVAGDGPHRAVVEREVAALGLGQHVRLLGNVSPEPLLSASDIYVHMAMNEGCSLAIIEAMHAAKPIVAANAGGTPEVLASGESALLIEPEPHELAEAVRTLTSDVQYRRKLGARAREVALEGYTRSVIGGQYEVTYRSLLAHSHSGGPRL